MRLRLAMLPAKLKVFTQKTLNSRRFDSMIEKSSLGQD